MALRRVLAAGRTDVVHLHSSGGPGVLRDLALLLITRVYRRPAVYHLHFGRIPEIAGRGSREWRSMASAMRLATVVLVLDEASESTVRNQLPTVWVRRMPNGVDLDRLPAPHRNPAPAERTVLFVGWFLHAKGVEDLLAAWRTAAQPGWRLLFVGPADPAYLRSVTERHQPPASVSFLGELPHPDVLAMMARCDLFVLPSHTEGFPNVVVEAMALGCPVVATDVGATAEILGDDSGVVVAPSDPAGLAAALRDLMTDPARRAELADRARARVHRLYGLQSVLRQHTDLWRRVAGSPGTTAGRRPPLRGSTPSGPDRWSLRWCRPPVPCGRLDGSAVRAGTSENNASGSQAARAASQCPVSQIGRNITRNSPASRAPSREARPTGQMAAARTAA